jgi:hypothetical protein
MGWLSKKPAEEKNVQEGLPNIPPADEAAVRTSIIENIQQSTDSVLSLGNAVPQIGAAQTNFLTQITSKTPDKELIRDGTKKIADNTMQLFDITHKGQMAKLEAQTGEQQVAAEKWKRDQEVVRAERAKEASKKYLSWVGALGEKGGEGIGALGEKGGKGIGKGIGGILSGTLGGIASGLAGLLWYGWKERAEEHRQKMAKLSN